jgi:hypothetical protein
MIDTIKANILIVWLLLSFVGGIYVHKLFIDSTAQDIEMYRKEVALLNAQEIAKLKVENTTVQGKIIERVRTEIVYTECKHSDSDYKLLTENW